MVHLFPLHKGCSGHSMWGNELLVEICALPVLFQLLMLYKSNIDMKSAFL